MSASASASATPPPETGAVCADCGKPLPPGHKGAVCHTCLWADPDEREPLHDVKPGGIALRIPGHDVESEIARGGMGIVYRAWEREAARHVALKMLLPHLADEHGMRERFRLEARAIAALDHPSVLPVYHIGVADEVPYFTMKLADGGSLLERRDRFSGKWRDIAALVASLAEAVHFAHSHGVLHRDLKPGNVLFDDKDRPYLSDFGLVKIVDSESHLTRSRHFLGTPHYAAPEVAGASASEATVASDVWSLGAMLYELLAGRVPFESPGIPALLRKIVDEPAPPLPPEVPRDLAVICLKCLQKLPRQRFASAADLAGDLRRWLEGRSISARPMSRTERAWAWSRRNPALAGLGAGLFLALAVTAAALWRENAANVRALEESRNAGIVSRQAALDARAAQARSLLEEARAIRRGGRLIDRGAAINAVLASRKLNPSTDTRDELTTLLTMPQLEPIGSIPHMNRWYPSVDGSLTRYTSLEQNGIAVRSVGTAETVWPLLDVVIEGYRPGPLSPDGRFLVVRDQTRLTLWEDGKNKPLLVLEPAGMDPRFSPDGCLFAAGGLERPFFLCDLRESPPAVVPCMNGETGWYPVAFSADHRLLTVYRPFHFGLRVVDTATGQVKVECDAGRRADARVSPVQAAQWTRRGDFFVVGTRDGNLVRWSVGQTQPDWTIPAHNGSVDAVAIAADDRLLISQGRDGFVKFTNLQTLESLGSVPWAGISLAVSSDGNRLAIDRAEAGRMELLSCTVPAGAESGVLPPSRNQDPFAALVGDPRVIAWPDGSKFSVSSGVDVSTFESNSVRRPLSTELIGRVNDLALDFPSGRWLRLEADKIIVAAPSVAVLGEPPEVQLTRMGAASVAYDPVSRRVLLGFRKGFNLFNFALQNDGLKPKRETVSQWRLHGDRDFPVSALAWSPDGKLVAWVGTDNRNEDDETKLPPKYKGVPVLRVFSTAEGGAVKHLIVLPAAATKVAFTSDQTAVITAGSSTVTCYDLASGRARWHRPHSRTSREPAQLACARSAPVVAVTFAPHTVSLLDVATGESTLTLSHPQERTIQAMDLTPDGTRLLALAGNLVQLWRTDILVRELEEKLAEGAKAAATAP